MSYFYFGIWLFSRPTWNPGWRTFNPLEPRKHNFYIMPDFAYSGITNFIFQDSILLNHMWIALFRDYVYTDLFCIFMGLGFHTYWVLWDVIGKWIADDEFGENFSTCIMEIIEEWIHPSILNHFWSLLEFSVLFLDDSFYDYWNYVGITVLELLAEFKVIQPVKEISSSITSDFESIDLVPDVSALMSTTDARGGSVPDSTGEFIHHIGSSKQYYRLAKSRVISSSLYQGIQENKFRL